VTLLLLLETISYLPERAYLLARGFIIAKSEAVEIRIKRTPHPITHH